MRPRVVVAARSHLAFACVDLSAPTMLPTPLAFSRIMTAPLEGASSSSTMVADERPLPATVSDS